MKSIKTVSGLSGKRVVVRVDFNVPFKDGKIIDDFRIKKALPTIEYLAKKGAVVILISHVGEDGKQSLLPVAKQLKKYIKNLEFVDSPILSEQTSRAVYSMKKGGVVLLENLRKDDGEKNNSPSFARALSRYGDLFVNDAFSVSHRKHASVVGITKYIPGYAGLQMMEEIENLSKAFDPVHPFLFALGGAKFQTKIPLIKKFTKQADTVFIAGALANDFFKAKGFEVGLSMVDDGNLPIASLLKSKNLLLPIDVCAVKGKDKRYVKPDQVEKDEMIMDLGPASIKMLEDLIHKSKFILWNGPFGKYEVGFSNSTEQIIKMIAKADIYSIVGGGDTVSMISKLKLEDKFNFVSTGGGATLDFLAEGTLPGIKALK